MPSLILPVTVKHLSSIHQQYTALYSCFNATVPHQMKTISAYSSSHNSCSLKLPLLISKGIFLFLKLLKHIVLGSTVESDPIQSRTITWPKHQRTTWLLPFPYCNLGRPGSMLTINLYSTAQALRAHSTKQISFGTKILTACRKLN